MRRNRLISGIVPSKSGRLPFVSILKKAGHANRKFITPMPRVNNSEDLAKVSTFSVWPRRTSAKIVEE